MAEVPHAVTGDAPEKLRLSTKSVAKVLEFRPFGLRGSAFQALGLRVEGFRRQRLGRIVCVCACVCVCVSVCVCVCVCVSGRSV